MQHIIADDELGPCDSWCSPVSWNGHGTCPCSTNRPKSFIGACLQAALACLSTGSQQYLVQQQHPCCLVQHTGTTTATYVKDCATDAGVAGSSLSPILTYFQGSNSIYTRDSSLTQRILQLLRTMVEAAAPDAVQLQCKPLMAVLLRMRGSIMLSAPLGDRELQLVSINAHPEC